MHLKAKSRCEIRPGASPEAAKIVFFSVPAAAFDIEDHCSGGSLFGKAFGSEVVVLPVVIPKRNRRCQRCISKAIGGANCAPKLQNLLFL